MKTILSFTIAVFIYLSLGFQRKSYSVFEPENKHAGLLITSIYKRDGTYVIKTSKGEVQPAVLSRRNFNDTTFLKIDNFSYMINLKYHSRSTAKATMFIFFDDNTNSIVLKEIFNKKTNSYIFKYTRNANFEIQ